MKKLTKITPEPEHCKDGAEANLEWLKEADNNSINDPIELIKLLIHKNNELTEAVIELQEKIKELNSK